MPSPSKIVESNENGEKTTWLKPNEVLALHKFKRKKKALQARINGTALSQSFCNDSSFTNNPVNTKRKNPFARNDENKRPKSEVAEPVSPDLGVSSDTTLFNLFNFSHSFNTSTSSLNSSVFSSPLTTFKNILQQSEVQNTIITKTDGEKWIPIDWTLKTKLRFMSTKPFAWNKKLKTSEEASGITGFVRCLDTRTSTSLDTSPNAQFHQCCLYWQHPCLPWITLFPRKAARTNIIIPSQAAMKESLHSACADSFRSLFQLVRARQCPYFYVCTNSFTALFRGAGICGYTEMHVMVTPTTRGFRSVLKQEEIDFTMPLKNKRQSFDATDSSYDTQDSIMSQQLSEDSNLIESSQMDDDDDEPSNEEWLQSMGVNADDIKKINYTQTKEVHKAECQVDNSEQSLIFVEGVEAHAFYNFLINCKSIVATTGPLANIPPTLLAPVAFHGASLQSLKVRENRVFDNNKDYYSLEICGPVLPHTIHNLCALLPKDSCMTCTSGNISSTAAFCKVNSQLTAKLNEDEKTPAINDSIAGSVFFGQENLSDCGLNKEVLKHFCSADTNHVQHFDSLKFNSESGLYTWL